MEKETITWKRDTTWRQGHVLTSEAITNLNLHHSLGPERTVVIIVSHDCDLANENLEVEPTVEVIIGCLMDEPNGSLTWAKSPRTLHVEADRNGEKVIIELSATAKHLIPKKSLALYKPESTHTLSSNSLSIIRSWLAVRYNRTAFPDVFIERLKKPFKTLEKLESLLKPTHHLLSAIFFDVDNGQAIDRTDGSPYSLSVVLAYPAGEDPENTADQADELAEAIYTLFQQKYFHQESGTWSEIELKSCFAISEEELKVSQARKLTEFRFEHLSLREG